MGDSSAYRLTTLLADSFTDGGSIVNIASRAYLGNFASSTTRGTFEQRTTETGRLRVCAECLRIGLLSALWHRQSVHLGIPL